MNKKRKKVLIWYSIISLILLVAALAVHPFDDMYKNYIQSPSLHEIPASLKAFMEVLKTFGKGDVVILIALGFAAVGFKKKALRILIAMAIMGVMVNGLKYTVQRERPNHSSSHVSFPSGDTATATTFFVASATEFPVLAPATAVGPAVGFLRTYDNYHFASDVLAGLAFGILAVVLAAYFNKFKFVKRAGKLKARLFLLGTLLMFVIICLPEALRGSGDRYNFLLFFGPSFLICIASVYSRLFAIDHVEKTTLFSRLFKLRRGYNNYMVSKIDNNLKKMIFNKQFILSIFLAGIAGIFITWSTGTSTALILCITGLILGILSSFFMITKQYYFSKNRRCATHTLVNSLCIIILFIVVNLIPVLVRL